MKFLFKKLIHSTIGRPTFLRRLQWSVIKRLLDLQDDQALLDLGSGPMQYSISIRKNSNVRVIAADLDFRHELIDDSRRYGVKLVRANGLTLPFADQSMDYILMSSLLQMVPTPKDLLLECHRVLEPTGCMVISVPNHYQFITKWMNSPYSSLIKKIFRLPSSLDELISHLNMKFHVGGKQGYYSRDELECLLDASGFTIEEHEYAPGFIGSILWELGVLSYVRIGDIAFHLLFLMYPFARLYDFFVKPSFGSEHIIKVRPKHGI